MASDPVPNVLARLESGKQQITSCNCEHPSAPLLVNSRQAADMLAVSERTLWSLTAPRGPLPCVRIGMAVRYALGDLQAFVGQHREVTP